MGSGARRLPTFEGAEILTCRHLHSMEHRRCSGACQFDWNVEQISASMPAADVPLGMDA